MYVCACVCACGCVDGITLLKKLVIAIDPNFASVVCFVVLLLCLRCLGIPYPSTPRDMVWMIVANSSYLLVIARPPFGAPICPLL
jgi:hypothetical protein